jgi:hypothetical protein
VDWFRNAYGHVVWANTSADTYDLGGFAYQNIGTSLLTFDGESLSLFTQRERSGGQLYPESFTIPAVSGLPIDGRFDYSDQRQRVRLRGPIPEGLWQIGPGYRYGGTLPVGYHGPDGTAFFVDLAPVQAETFGRSGFEIHPDGNTLGTAGCIGLNTADMQRLREFYTLLTRQIEEAPQGKAPMLHVDYSGENDER